MFFSSFIQTILSASELHRIMLWLTPRLVGFTTGRELHPALKILFYFYQQFLNFILLMSESILLTFIYVKIFSNI